MNPTVWLLAATFEPRGRSLYTLGLARHLEANGFHPKIVCESAAQIPKRLRPTLDILEMPHLANRLLTPLTVRRLLPAAAAPGAQPPTLLHAQRRSLARITLELARRLRRPYLVSIHDAMKPGDTIPVLPEYLGGLVAVSPTVEEDLVRETRIPGRLVFMIPNGVEPAPTALLPAPRSAARVPGVGVASPLEPVKGILYFLLAAELILSSGQDVEFLVAGSGPDEEILRRAAEKLELTNRVTFVGYLQSYTPILDAVDVFVMPSLEQGLGTIMLEAMARGKPVVATKVGGIADYFIDGEHALLVPPGDHVALAEKIQFLLDNPDRARVLAVGGQGLVRRQFSVDRMAAETADLYRRVLADFEADRTARADERRRTTEDSDPPILSVKEWKR
ncbi:MAG: glycosyltransferase family 4 protein [Planctomycetia bacterium]